jgi:hypothetical protein
MNWVFVWTIRSGKFLETYKRGAVMAIKGCPVRKSHVVWRDIAGEVVIAERNSTLHVLNRTASLIWSLADGSRQMEEIISEICNRFEVTREEALLDAEEFCHELLQAGLVTMDGHTETN